MEKQAYEKQMARITLLKQTEQKNLHLVKCNLESVG